MRTMMITTIFNGINKLSQSILPSLSSHITGSSCHLLFYQAAGALSRSRSTIFSQKSAIYHEEILREGGTHRARPVGTLTLKLFPRKHRFFREFGSFGSQARSAQPGNLSTGYPQIYTQREFGEFEAPQTYCLMLLLSWYTSKYI